MFKLLFGLTVRNPQVADGHQLGNTDVGWKFEVQYECIPVSHSHMTPDMHNCYWRSKSILISSNRDFNVLADFTYKTVPDLYIFLTSIENLTWNDNSEAQNLCQVTGTYDMRTG